MEKLTIVGGGIVGALQAYYAFLKAKAEGKQLRITVYDAHPELPGTTAMNIAPSLTPDEILSVVPRGEKLLAGLSRLFNEPLGIRVDDAKSIEGLTPQETLSGQSFIESVTIDGSNDELYKEREKLLFELGKISMDLWQELYDHATPELKHILEISNFNPCREPTDPSHKELHKGYRIDLLSGIENASARAQGMRDNYKRLGYASCEILSPADTVAIDPSLKDFCDTHSERNAFGDLVWKNDAVALWRPGGCIDIKTFLPLFYEYLSNQMGEYTNTKGQNKKCFRLKLGREVTSVAYDESEPSTISGLSFSDLTRPKRNKSIYENSAYAFCPGSAVGTLKKLGFEEPNYAGFAGASLKLSISATPEELDRFSTLNHCMEVHREGVVLAWQARVLDGKILIAVAGTKAFYADIAPHKDDAFACDRNLLQLNMINEVLPEAISLALKKDTRGQMLTAEDLNRLEADGIAARWVGTRAVTYDGFPTWGPVFTHVGQVLNAWCITSLGSGGVSFAPAAVKTSTMTDAHSPFFQRLLGLGKSTRTPTQNLQPST